MSTQLAEKPKSQGEIVLEEFETQLKEREESLATMLPPTLSRAVFMETVSTAVRANPSLLRCDRRSFFAACVKCAKDGLVPDGKEAALVPRKDENGNLIVGYQPMVWGIRKRARQTDDLILDAQCVRENDLWKRQQGDDAKIIHEPLDEWKGPRGKLVAVYLIVRKPSVQGEIILHREVMYASDVMKVKAISKRQNADHWNPNKFEEEGWKKSVVHRGIKSVPCSDALREVLSRDYDEFNLNDDATGPFAVPSASALPVPPPSTKPAKVSLPPSPIAAPAPDAAAPASAAPSDGKDAPSASDEFDAASSKAFLDTLEKELAATKSLLEAQAVWGDRDEMIETRLPEASRREAYKMWDRHEARFGKKQKRG